MSFHSIRFRLTFWYAVTLAVVLTASGLFWHYFLSSNLIEHVDTRLLGVARELRENQLNTNPNSLSHNQCEEMERYYRLHNWPGFIQIQNELGTITCFSPNLKGRLPLSKDALQRATRGIPTYETTKTQNDISIRLLTFPLREDGKLTQLIQAAEDLQPMMQTLDDFHLFLLTFSPMALIVVSIGGWFMAHRALSPVTQIIRSAQSIGANNLSQRLPVKKNGDEISQLAETFNAMLARLEEEFRRTKQFSADASHELRTPLTILRGETEVALRWAKTTDEFREMLTSNMEEIDRMGRMIEDLLTLAKSDAGDMILATKEFSLTDMLGRLFLGGKTLAEPKGIDLGITAGGEIMIVGDELRLRQLFLNLISNAIKYSPAGSSVRIDMGEENGMVRVAISDTGIGIPEEHLPCIFDRFYRIDKARNREDGGTGLGLAIVKSIVEAHGGTINVSSELGKGSTFTVHLPQDGSFAKRKAGS